MIKLSEQFNIVKAFMHQAPVDVENMARALGIRLRKSNLKSSISGMIERQGDNEYIITVNENHPLTRQRFTIAHEIGHFIYHKGKMDSPITDNIMYRAENNLEIGRKEESQANSFAANVLMPEPLVRKLVEKHGKKNIDAIADELGVSRQAMKIRIENL